jgi:molybdopterin-guanine dinucleotide biosynthesis protein A
MATSAPPGSAPDQPRYALVLAGGSGRRLGSVDKPGLIVAGQSLLARALRAVAPALTVVVGPQRDLPPGVLGITEDPPHGGPAAGLAAGLALLARDHPVRGGTDLVAVLAADLPGIDPPAVRSLAVAVLRDEVDGAVLIDPGGRDQYLAGVWRVGALLAATRSRASWHGGRLSDLLGPLVGARVPAGWSVAADIDTTADLLQWGATAPVVESGQATPIQQVEPAGDDGVVR